MSIKRRGRACHSLRCRDLRPFFLRRTCCRRRLLRLNSTTGFWNCRPEWLQGHEKRSSIFLKSMERIYFRYRGNGCDRWCRDTTTIIRCRGTLTVRWFRARLAPLRHRSQRHRMPWERFRSIIDRYLPSPRILHPWPGVRFTARYLR